MTNLDYIKIYDDVIDEDTSNYYINLINKSNKKAGKVFDGKGSTYVNIQTKLSEDVCISSEHPKEASILLKLFSDYSVKYEKDIGIKLPIKNAEFIAGRIYKKNTGFYKPHIDSGSPGNCFRCITLILYLNTVLEGGELVFPHQNKTIQAIRARLVIFPSAWMYLHGANVPISNDRYIIRTFMNSN